MTSDAQPATALPAHHATLDWREHVGSTQDELQELVTAGQSQHGTAVATADQRAGRGRHGRVWTAPPGSALALSVLVDPGHWQPRLADAHLSWVSLVAASAVAEVLADLGVPVHVKWPNDVMVADGRKICGILAALTPRSDGDPVLVIGMGINLDHSAGAPVPTATAVGDWVGPDAIPTPRALAERVHAAVLTALDDWAHRLGDRRTAVTGEHPALAGVVRWLSTLGREVDAHLPDGTTLQGTVVGLGPGGSLLMEKCDVSHAKMEAREITAADVVHLRGDVRTATPSAPPKEG
ncbi:MAG: biotin--[acetyl-CoA-carboxylase] ligase [Micrococcus sp.]|nr:biotin--[acetyl-CoA-carboxylase] ligase [Micrococcus sp.]